MSVEQGVRVKGGEGQGRMWLLLIKVIKDNGYCKRESE